MIVLKKSAILKVLVFLFVLGTLQSCTSDDSLKDSILGSWELYKIKANEQEHTPGCNDLLTLEFSNNQEVFITSYKNENGECTEKEVVESNWSDLGDSFYSLDFIDSSGQSILVNFETIDYFDFKETYFVEGEEFTQTYYYKRK